MMKQNFRLSILLEISGVALLSLGLVHTLFYFVQKTHADNVERSIQTILRNEVNVGEPYRIAASVTDLESLGLLRCSVLRNLGEERSFQDLRFKHSPNECSPSFLRLDGLAKDTTPTGINGQIWKISFVTSNPSSFYTLLWFARVFAVFASVLIYVLTRRYLRSRVQQAELKEQIAAAVAHDIRSPLAALESALPDIEQLPEDIRVLLKDATNRVRDIANDLLKTSTGRVTRRRYRNSKAAQSEATGTCLLAPLVSSVVSEKRLQYRARLGTDIEAVLGPSSYGLFANIDRVLFQRVISNLVNNAVEALPGKGLVTISLAAKGSDDILITVFDNGKGIPKDLISKLLTEGGSYGKEGSGIGLSSSIEAVKSWGGDLAIESEPGKGTVILIRIPRASPPSWFVPTLTIKPQQTVVVLDDDTSIHQLWRNRLDALKAQGFKPSIVAFTAPEHLATYLSEAGPEFQTSLFLVDYELAGCQQSGLDVIEQLGIAKQSILVTSHYEDARILSRVGNLGIPLLPKGQAPFIPIAAVPVAESATGAVLIDDDDLVHKAWRTAEKWAPYPVAYFYSATDFLALVHTFPKTTVIYIDSKLGNGVSGEVISKDIFDLGFTEIYLITGYRKGKFSALPHIKEIRDKKPPW